MRINTETVSLVKQLSLSKIILYCIVFADRLNEMKSNCRIIGKSQSRAKRLDESTHNSGMLEHSINKLRKDMYIY